MFARLSTFLRLADREGILAPEGPRVVVDFGIILNSRALRINHLVISLNLSASKLPDWSLGVTCDELVDAEIDNAQG